MDSPESFTPLHIFLLKNYSSWLIDCVSFEVKFIFPWCVHGLLYSFILWDPDTFAG